MPHLHEKVDFTAEVFIVHNHKVLLRLHDKYHIWLGVGGHVELDEDPNQAAVREAKEEVGLDVRLFPNGILYSAALPGAGEESGYVELIPPRFMNRHRINENHEHVTLIYLATAASDGIGPSETEKSDGIKWFTKEELLNDRYDIRPTIKHYALAALAEVK